jgi:hypothetical protein
MSLGRASAIAIGSIVLGVAGCGGGGPHAPPRQSLELGHATGGISTACGRAYRVVEFPDHDRAKLDELASSAGKSARKLASVYRRNPAWVYQGETVNQLVEDSISYLRSCHLERPAALLIRLTRPS